MLQSPQKQGLTLTATSNWLDCWKVVNPAHLFNAFFVLVIVK